MLDFYPIKLLKYFKEYHLEFFTLLFRFTCMTFQQSAPGSYSVPEKMLECECV